MRVEFCDADVLDVFDEWRRAVGVPAGGAASSEDAHARRQASLTAHLERVVARLTLLRASDRLALADVVDPMVAELDVARQSAKGLRGDARRVLLDRLRTLDESLVTAVRNRIEAGTREGLAEAADEELRAFRDRMPPEAYANARAACVDRLIRDRYGLPIVALE
jgi:hypothetical protein